MLDFRLLLISERIILECTGFFSNVADFGRIVWQCVGFFCEIPEDLLISAALSSINIPARCASLAQLDRASAF